MHNHPSTTPNTMSSTDDDKSLHFKRPGKKTILFYYPILYIIVSIFFTNIVIVANMIIMDTSLFSTKTSAWQDARISRVRVGTLVISVSKSELSVNPPTPENSCHYICTTIIISAKTAQDN